MKKVLFIYPRKGGSNPYVDNLTKALTDEYTHLEYAKGEEKWPPFISLLRASFMSDILILNWPENVAFGKFSKLQTFCVLFSLHVAKYRKAKLIWVFHNIVPHYGVNKKSQLITNFLYKHSSLMLCHSEEAKIFAENRAKSKVVFIHHPIRPIACIPIHVDENIDLLYWGDIYDYKGIDILAEELSKNNSSIRLHILGRCKSEKLRHRLYNCVSSKITFDEKFADVDTIAGYIKQTKYVIFPYTGDSISSSGALIDTLYLGGTILGPAKGAFIDLEKRGLCFTYNSYEELLQLIKQPIRVNEEIRKQFIVDNSWEKFGRRVSKIIKSL